MAENTKTPVSTVPVAEVETPAKNVNVNVSLPADLYAKLYDDYRFELRLDKGPFGRHVFEEFAKTIPTKGA